MNLQVYGKIRVQQIYFLPLISLDVNVLVANELGATNELWYHVLWTFAEAFHKVLKRNGDNVSYEF